MNVKNRQVEIFNIVTEQEQEIIHKYWKFQEEELINKPSVIAKQYDLAPHVVPRIVAQNAVLKLEVFCNHCNKDKEVKISSQTAYRNIIQHKDFTCGTCQNKIDEKHRLEQERIREEERIKQEELIKKQRKLLNDAIDNKHWEQLNRFEFKLLQNILTNNLRSLKLRYSNTANNYFWGAIFKLRDLSLVFLEYNYFGSSVTEILTLKRLEEALPSDLIIEESDNNEDVNFNKETNELRFRLTKNPNAYSYDSPEYSGTLEFPKTVTLKPGIEYTFGAWKRQNDVLYLSIIPTEDKYVLPKQNNKAW